MNRLKEKYYIALGSLQNMAIDNTKGSKGVDICVSGINEYVAYLQSKIDKVIELIHKAMMESDITGNGTLNLNELLDILKEDK